MLSRVCAVVYCMYSFRLKHCRGRGQFSHPKVLPPKQLLCRLIKRILAIACLVSSTLCFTRTCTLTYLLAIMTTYTVPDVQVNSGMLLSELLLPVAVSFIIFSKFGSRIVLVIFIDRASRENSIR